MMLKNEIGALILRVVLGDYLFYSWIRKIPRWY